MQQYIEICKNMQKSKKFYANFCMLYTYLVILDHKHRFKPNLYFYVIYANMQNSGLYL